MQDLTGLRDQLLAAESVTSTAVKESAHLRQQLRAANAKAQGMPESTKVVELSRQTSSAFDQIMKETYEALRDEFQPDVAYKVICYGCCAGGRTLVLITPQLCSKLAWSGQYMERTVHTVRILMPSVLTSSRNDILVPAANWMLAPVHACLICGHVSMRLVY